MKGDLPIDRKNSGLRKGKLAAGDRSAAAGRRRNSEPAGGATRPGEKLFFPVPRKHGKSFFPHRSDGGEAGIYSRHSGRDASQPLSAGEVTAVEQGQGQPCPFFLFIGRTKKIGGKSYEKLVEKKC